MKILTVAGSVRSGSLTKKTIEYINLYLTDKVELTHIDLNTEKLVLPGQGTPSAQLIERAKNVNAVIIATPEYHGSYSAAIKLFLENLEYPSVLSGKPVALIGVAAGVLGATKALEHLRSVCNHINMIALPRVVCIASSYQAFDKEGNLTDEDLKKRLQVLADELIEFSKKLA